MSWITLNMLVVMYNTIVVGIIFSSSFKLQNEKILDFVWSGE